MPGDGNGHHDCTGGVSGRSCGTGSAGAGNAGGGNSTKGNAGSASLQASTANGDTGSASRGAGCGADAGGRHAPKTAPVRAGFANVRIGVGSKIGVVAVNRIGNRQIIIIGT